MLRALLQSVLRVMYARFAMSTLGLCVTPPLDRGLPDEDTGVDLLCHFSQTDSLYVCCFERVGY